MKPSLDAVTEILNESAWRRYSRERPRDVIEIQRFCLAYVRRDAPHWTDADWAEEIGLGPAHFERILSRLRARNLMDPLTYDLHIARLRTPEPPERAPAPVSVASTSRVRAFRERERNGSETLHETRNETVETASELLHETATETAGALQRNSPAGNTETPLARVSAEPDSGTGPESVGNINISKPKTGTGLGRCTVDRLVAESMSHADAEARVAEFGETRWQEALEALRFRRFGKKAPDPGRGAGWLFDFVRNERPLPKAMIAQRERDARAAMQTSAPMLAVSDEPSPSAQPVPATKVPPRQARSNGPVISGDPTPEEIRAWRAHVDSMMDGIETQQATG